MTTKTNEPTRVDPAMIVNLVVTVNDISQRSDPDNIYHPFVWDFTVEDSIGRDFIFSLNPSRSRNKLVNQLKTSGLPAHNMKLVDKEFMDKKTGENITYYELQNANQLRDKKK